MRFIVSLILSLLFLLQTVNYSFAIGTRPHKNYQAIVLGKITKEKVKKVRNTYITEYKLKTKKWFYRNPDVKKTKYVTIKVLGAILKEKGIVVKASTTPDYIPINKDAIFYLEQNKLKQKDVFTLSHDGILYKSNTNMSKD